MRDPYLYEDAPVLKNLLNIKHAGMLVKAEAEGGKQYGTAIFISQWLCP